MMTQRRIAACSCVALAFFLAPAPSWAGEPTEFTPVSVEQLLEPSVPLGRKDVEIVLRKIRLDAKVAALPAPRRAHYLTGVLRDMGADPVPQVSHGMDIASPAGKTLNVYLEDSAAERAKQELRPGQSITLYGYHVYSSRHGPGILASGFEPHSRLGEWQERLGKWLHDR
jgi:hypothetical protein